VVVAPTLVQAGARYCRPMLYLVRHGQTEANARGLLLGRADPPLSELGRRQAAALRDLLPGSARIVASPLIRTRETAEALGEENGATVELDDRWLELDYGEYDEMPLADVPADVWRRWRTDLDFAPPGGESLAALGERVRAACAELAAEAAKRDVVVVSHVSPIKAALTWALGVGDETQWRMFVAVASVATVATDGWAPSLRSFNQVPVVDGDTLRP
jgi:broad specificity phosphatase PhoE